MQKQRSLRRRVTLGVTLTLLLVLGTAGVAMDRLVERFLFERAEDKLLAVTEGFQGVLRAGLDEAGTPEAATGDESIDRLRTRLRHADIGEAEHVYILDMQGKVLLHPRLEGADALEVTDRTTGERVVRTVMDDIRRQLEDGRRDPTGIIRYQLDEDQYGAPGDRITSYRYVPEREWVLGVVMGKSVVTAPIERARILLGVLLVTALAVAVGLVSAVTHSTLSSLRALVEAVRRYRIGGGIQALPESQDREVATLSDAFQGLIERVEAHESELQDLVSERTASLKEREAFLNAMLHASPAGIVLTDKAGRVQWLNDQAARMVRASGEHSVGAHLVHLFRGVSDEEAGVDLERVHGALAVEGRYRQRLQVRLQGGLPRWVELHAEPMEEGGEERYLVWILNDVTEQRDREEELKRLARTDVLTGAPNRAALEDHLEILHHRFHRYGHRYCVAMIDVDSFKTLNDEYGHEEGDRILQRIASTIPRSIRESDYYGRWGGEEFLILAPETGLEGGRAVCEKLRAAIHDQIARPDGTPVSVSLGLAEARAEEAAAETVRRADEALYRAKREGRNRVCVADGNTEA